MIQKLGKYAIIEKLGEGSMGAVYKAYDSVLDRHVAIKTMADEIKWDPELKLRFYREARSAANLHHPNIVTIHDLGEEGKITYIVMELLQGSDLKTIIADKVLLTLEDKISIIAQVADGLNHAHLNGIIHRDIKPGNIHVSVSGNVKILDFGIARIPSSDLTRIGARLGTPVYMSPEQIRGEEYDARSDIFSAGIVFYELLTYVHPFRDKKIAKTLDNILYLNQFAFEEQFPDAPLGLWPILSPCLAKEAKNRYARMADLSRACHDLLAEMTLQRQLMARELEASLPLLRRAAESPETPARIVELLNSAQAILGQREKQDFLSLQRFLALLSKEPLGVGAMEPASLHEAGTPGSGSDLPPPSAEGTSKFSPGERAAQTASLPSPPAPGKPGVPADEKEPSAQIRPSASGTEARDLELIQKAEQLLKEDRLEESLEHLRQAIGVAGPRDELVRMLSEARRRLDERKRARLSGLLESASAARARGQLMQAIESLDEALGLESGQTEAVEMRRQILAELEAERNRQARREEGEHEKILGFKLLAEKRFRDSLRSLRRASELLGEDNAVRLGIAEAEDGVRAEDLRASAQAELEEASRLFRSQAFEKARAHANRVLELSPKHPEATDLLARIDQEEKEKQKLELVSSLLTRSQQALSQNDFNGSASLANEALRLSPSHPQIEQFIDSIYKAKEETRRKEEVLKLLAKAEEALGSRNFDDAEEQAKQALRVIPGQPKAAEFLKRIEQAREQQRRAQEISRMLAEAEDACSRGSLDQAENRIRRVLELDPRNDAARSLLQRIQQSREKNRRDQIHALLEKGRAALAAGELTQAASQAKDILLLDEHDKDAHQLLSEAERLKEQRRLEEIANLLSRSRQALAEQKFDEAGSSVKAVLERAPRHKEAKALLKQINKACRAWEKERRKQDRSPEPAGAVAGDRSAETALDRTVIMSKPERAKLPGVLIAAAAALVVLGVSLGAFYLRQHRKTEAPDLPSRIAAARSSLDQKQYDQAIDLAQGILSASPGDGQAQAILAEAQKQKKQATIEILMLETQNLRSQNQLEDSLKTVDKVLEIDPDYQPALAVRSQLETEISASKSREEQDKEIQDWLARADSLLAAGKLAEAKIELDKVGSLRPDAPELPGLRRRLGAKAAELGRSRKEELEAAQKQKRVSELETKAAESFRQGKYHETQSVADQLLAETPQDSRAQSLRTQANDALATMRIYEAAFAAKDYNAAIGAVSRLEKINPSDPSIAELRKRAEASKAAAKATLSIYRLGEPGILTLDDQRVGTEGELENKVVSAGRHKIQIRGANGKLGTFEYEFLDGQNLAFVYDSAAAELRPFTPADREAIARRKLREETRRFPVEHLHGFLKGKCTGDLLINGFRVEYKPSEGDHHFLIPFQNLKLVIKDEKLEFTETPGGRQLQFKPRDAKQAGIIKKYWDTLEKLGK